MELIHDASLWHQHLQTLPAPHPLQTWEWGAFKSRYGWQARRCWWANGAAAQVLTRTSARGLARVLYIPKGPILDWGNTALVQQVLSDLEALARRERAIVLKFDPDVPLATGLPGEAPLDPVGSQLEQTLNERGWRFSPDQIQFRNTVQLDLRPTEAEILARMKQKTRYNVRLAEKKGVQVRLGQLADLPLLYRLYAETSVRDGFVIRSADYYRDAWGSLMTAGRAQALIAEVEGEPVSALILVYFGPLALYMYGMSRNLHRDKMPNHLLQWEAMRWAKAHGCTTYDFWGAPDEFAETDAMWGVWKFKEGFNGEVKQHLGAWDFAPTPWLYRLYTTVLPRVLDFMRRRGRAATRQSLEAA